MARKMTTGQRVKIALSCGVCGRRNYKTDRARGGGSALELKKFCPGCNLHTLHKEAK